MPNWCSNEFTMTKENVSEEKLTKIIGNITKWKFFDYFYPVSDKVKIANDPDELSDEERTWRIDNWGTKWDIAAPTLVSFSHIKGKLTLTLTFETAWSPPINFCEKLTKLGWYVELRYREESMGFYGAYNSNSGDECHEF